MMFLQLGSALTPPNLQPAPHTSRAVYLPARDLARLDTANECGRVTSHHKNG
jgi:hypothetical protein